MQKQLSEGFIKKGVVSDFADFTRKYLCWNSFLGVFLWILRNLQEYLFLQNSTGRMLLIIAVSIVPKGVLAKETVNYETKTKAYVLLWARKCKLLQKAVQGKEACRLSQMFFKLGVLKIFVNSTKASVLEPLLNKAEGLEVCNSIKNRLQHSCFPVKLINFLIIPFLQQSFSGCLWRFNSCFQRSSEQKPLRTVCNKYQIRLKKNICCHDNLELATAGVL